MRTSKVYLFGACESKGASRYHILTDLKQAEDWESLMVENGSLQVCSTEGCWHGEAGRLTGNGTSYVLVRGAYLAVSGWFLVGSQGKH